MTSRRLSICYVVPGHDLLATVGPSRNVLSLARSLSRHADVTVAFRRVNRPDVPAGLRALEIEPAATATTIDDSAMRGVSIPEFLKFLRALRRFTERELQGFDVVLEKSWLLSGYVSSLCRRRGQLGVPIENIVPNAAQAARGQWMKLLRLKAGSWIAGRLLRGAPLVIAETEFLKKEIGDFWKIPLERIAVVDLGVDRNLFRPADQGAARNALGIDADDDSASLCRRSRLYAQPRSGNHRARVRPAAESRIARRRRWAARVRVPEACAGIGSERQVSWPGPAWPGSAMDRSERSLPRTL